MGIVIWILHAGLALVFLLTGVRLLRSPWNRLAESRWTRWAATASRRVQIAVAVLQLTAAALLLLLPLFGLGILTLPVAAVAALVGLGVVIKNLWRRDYSAAGMKAAFALGLAGLCVGHWAAEEIEMVLFLKSSRDYQQASLVWQQRHDARAPKAGDLAPDFELADVTGTKQFRLSDFRGKRPVALVFGSFT